MPVPLVLVHLEAQACSGCQQRAAGGSPASALPVCVNVCAREQIWRHVAAQSRTRCSKFSKKRNAERITGRGQAREGRRAATRPRRAWSSRQARARVTPPWRAEAWRWIAGAPAARSCVAARGCCSWSRLRLRSFSTLARQRGARLLQLPLLLLLSEALGASRRPRGGATHPRAAWLSSSVSLLLRPPLPLAPCHPAHAPPSAAASQARAGASRVPRAAAVCCALPNKQAVSGGGGGES